MENCVLRKYTIFDCLFYFILKRKKRKEDYMEEIPTFYRRMYFLASRFFTFGETAEDKRVFNALRPDLAKKITKRKTKWQTYDDQTKIEKTVTRMVRTRTLLDEYMRKLLPEHKKLDLKTKIDKALSLNLISKEQSSRFHEIRLLGNTAVHEPKKMNPGDKQVQHRVNVYYNYIWAALQQSELFRPDPFFKPKKKAEGNLA